MDGMTPRRLPSNAKRNEFSPSVIGRSWSRLHDPKTSARPVNAAPASAAATTAATEKASVAIRRRRGRRRRRRARRRAISAATSTSSCTGVLPFCPPSVPQKLAEQRTEHRQDDRDQQVQPPDPYEDRTKPLRPAVADLAREPGAEHVIVQIRARDE